jgi:hypothetical protein
VAATVAAGAGAAEVGEIVAAVGSAAIASKFQQSCFRNESCAQRDSFFLNLESSEASWADTAVLCRFSTIRI